MKERETRDFLRTISPSQAFDLIMGYEIEVQTEVIRIEEAVGRVLAEDIISPENLPPFPRSLVDGYAVRSQDTYGASETNPVLLEKKGLLKVGEVPEIRLGEGECVYVSTGSFIPEGAESVIMQEFAREANGFVEILKPVHKGENVMKEGEDLKRGDFVLKKGEKVNPIHIGVLSSLGITSLKVARRVKVGILSTGDEIVSPYDPLVLGKVRDINGYLLRSLFSSLGGMPKYAGIAKDDPYELRERLASLLDCDLICVSGGSSKGERDLIVEVVKELGGRVLFHGVSIRPGKPFFFSILNQKPLFGLPGHPLSMWLVTQRFVLPLFYKIQGRKGKERGFIFGKLASNVPSSYGIEEYVNAKISIHGDEVFVEPIFSKSGMVSALLSSSGYIVIDENLEGLERGKMVKLFLYDL